MKGRSEKNHYGLGLYIVSEIVKQHMGTLRLYNSKEHGNAVVEIQFTSSDLYS